MSHTIIYDTVTRAILAVDPRLDSKSQPILPLGLPTAAVATITDVEAAKIGTAGGAFTLANDNLTVIVTSVVQPLTPLRDAVYAGALGSVGVTLSNLTQAQRLALVGCLLFKVGALDPVTLAVRPLDQWLV